ncbi:hypothetical protein [Sinomicrobium weinanense]|uniref:Uncharacterized protein n=1 Tax=Sinomicrobium weinanense TaxID=2842200 RepID=A0A926Q2M0_9FLAO|nr:hypothetical protein [Sinomicrobium weinanense]MBC9795071.1 hypothetical protein [Sinomicrobium weinanense]MBU3123800.1 hypothetical protein [Sinomicrobium weinanense]
MGKKTKEEIKAGLREKYGVDKVYEWAGYADEPREKPLVDAVEHVAKELNFAPSYLYTIAIGEGLGVTYADILANYKDDVLKTDVSIDGYQSLGVDDFSSDFPRVKKYLPEDYNEGDEYTSKQIVRNEWGGETVVNSATFDGLKNALYGFGAILLHRRDRFLEHKREFKYGIPTEDQSAFWTYVYFQGEGTGRKYLENNGDMDYTSAPPSNVARIGGPDGIRYKALERLATWRYMKTKKIFSE